MPSERSREFDQYPQPPWNTTTSVEAALNRVGHAATEADAAAAYEALLNAVGNNHAGTYYPVVLAIVNRLGFHVEFGEPWAQYAAVQVLLDLAGSFEPEAGHDVFGMDGAKPASLRAQLQEHVQALATKLEFLARCERPASTCAQELLELIEDTA